MKLTIDFEKVEYRNPKNRMAALYASFVSAGQKLTGSTPVYPRLRHKGKFRLLKRASYNELGRAISFDDKTNTFIPFHKKRLALYDFLQVFAYIFVFLILAIFLFFAMAISFAALNVSFTSQGVLENSLLFGLLIIIAVFALRIAVIFVDKHYADTLSAISSIYLLIELAQDDVITDPEKRRELLNRVRILERNIQLLPLCFSSGSSQNDLWIYSYFKKIENYVREREKWVVASTEKTLKTLREDFSTLAEIMVSGNYGEFIPKEQERDEEPDQNLPTSPKYTSLLRLLATILPFILLIAIFIFPNAINALGIDNNIVALFLLAWLLLAIDSSLRLGILDNATTIIKTLRELR